MSRHRDVRNLNIHDELAQDDLSDDYDEEDEMTAEQKDRMATGLVQVRSVLGDEDESGIKDKQIKDALWDSYFDVEGTISWLLDQRAKQAATAAKKASDPDDAIQAPLTALQRLALQRKQAGATPATSGSSKPSGLASLAKGLSRKTPLQSVRPTATEPPAVPSIAGSTSPPATISASPPTKLSKLSALAQKSASQRNTPLSSLSRMAQTQAESGSLSNGPPLSKLALRIKAQKEAQEVASRPQPPPVETSNEESIKQTSKLEFKLFDALQPGAAVTPSPHLDGTPRLGALRAGPSPFGNVLVSRRQSIELGGSFARVYSGIMSGPPSSAFQFNTPSPDDAVMAAREGTRLNAYKKASTVAGSRK
ncbi:Hsp70 suppressor, GTPase facilitates ribosomal subunit dissociation [Ceratobasidium sp. UAMH 11750]|nr:Hsp70 suppressor, GTPase facilitates ribosomal subunit dissociation [Ceratobasidium sp. UAMH 11750]